MVAQRQLASRAGEVLRRYGLGGDIRDIKRADAGFIVGFTLGVRDRGVHVFGVYLDVDMVSPRRALANCARRCPEPTIIDCNLPMCPGSDHDYAVDGDDDADDGDDDDGDDDDDDDGGDDDGDEEDMERLYHSCE